ncbi:MAG TPA: phosphoribosyltransferase, partial [Bryobacteraceae bacterium]|nr:phosphoribosyltransferase [Bryobacteraceae bacterium]
MQQFRDRPHAGRLLGQELLRFRGEPAPLILALPRGGVPVAFEVARVLKAPLDIFLVRKLGVPGQEELAMGAIASGGTRVLNDEIVRALRIPERTIDDVEARERRNLESRERLYRGSAPRAAVEARDVILIDDGLATGSTMRAAVSALRAERPSRIIVAVPVGAEPTCELLRRVADEVICLRTPQPFQAVGLWYEDFDQVTDATVRELLRAASGNGSGGQDILIPSGGVDLAADLVIPESARGLVLFAHGSG